MYVVQFVVSVASNMDDYVSFVYDRSSPTVTAVFGVQDVHDVRAEVEAGTALEIPVRSIHNVRLFVRSVIGININVISS